jgi:hypothetical protein
VLFMLDERLADDDADHWADVLADRAKLDAKLDALALPPPFFSQTILEKAWRMALADGGGSDTEAEVHDALAERLGIGKAEVASWREAWLERAAARAGTVAGFASILANLDGLTDSEERLRYDELLDTLPVSDERREELRGLIESPPAMDDVVGGLAAMEPDDRQIALMSIVPIVMATGASKERAAFLDLAEAVAVSRADAQAMLDR